MISTREEVLTIRPWAVFFPGEPPPSEQVVLYHPDAGRREEPQNPQNGSYFVAVGMAPTTGWWVCHRVESPETPNRRLYRVDPLEKTRLGLDCRVQYILADTPPVQPGSWYYTQEEYLKPVEFVLYPPDLRPIEEVKS